MLPVEPVTVIVVIDPLQIVAAAAAAEPPTLAELTVTNAEALVADPHEPLVTTAL